MVSAVTARWHGDNYQSRIFWENALNLLDPSACVVEVTFEADGPKAFDDVVVKYDPPITGSGPDRIPVDYQQVKWHVETGGRFGYVDFTEPSFIGATSFSLLQRLQQARVSAPIGARFTFLTTYRIRDADPLAPLIAGNDRSVLTKKLFDGSGDRSKTGKIRKLWREHLKLTSDQELQKVIEGFRVVDGHRSLDELRQSINLKARVSGLLTCAASDSDFRYDELARQLKARQINLLTPETLRRICGEEGLFMRQPIAPDNSLPIAIRSFLGPAADIPGAHPNDTLLLAGEFRERYLQDGKDWQTDIRPKVEAFLVAAAKKSAKLRVFLDAHASIAFLAGCVLDLKSGTEVELIQKGRVGSRSWRPDDGLAGSPLTDSSFVLGSGREFAVAIGIAQSVDIQVKAYVAANLPDVGMLLSFVPVSGPSAQAVAGGTHAAAMSEQISNALRAVKALDPDALVHIFPACPNSLLFFLGQQHRGIAPCIVYEFDFDRRGNKTYQPSFIMD